MDPRRRLAAQRKPDLQPATMALVLRGARAAGLLKQAANAPLAQVRPRPAPSRPSHPRPTPLSFPSRANQTKCSYDLPVSHLPRRAGGWRAPLRRDDGGTRGHGLARPRPRGPHVGGAPRNRRTRPRTPDRPARTTREKPSHCPSGADGRSKHTPRPMRAFPVRSRRPPSGRVLTSPLLPSPRAAPRGVRASLGLRRRVPRARAGPGARSHRGRERGCDVPGRRHGGTLRIVQLRQVGG